MTGAIGFIPLQGGSVELVYSLDDVEKVPGATVFRLIDRDPVAGDVVMWMYSRHGWLAQILVPSKPALRTEWVTVKEEQCL